MFIAYEPEGLQPDFDDDGACTDISFLGDIRPLCSFVIWMHCRRNAAPRRQPQPPDDIYFFHRHDSNHV